MPVTTNENRHDGPASVALRDAAATLARDWPTARAGELATEGEELCEILEPFRLDDDVLAAAALYPLAREAGDGVALLDEHGLGHLAPVLDGLKQLGRFSLPADWKAGESLASSQSDALRKMLLAVVADPRLVLVRIGEQLLRLRRAKKADPAQQERLALETREVYAPLASRLGVWQLKWELEDLAFRFSEPDTYRRIARALKEKRIEREAFIDGVTNLLQKELAGAGIEASVSGRPKHIYSIWRKMRRKDRGFEQIFDVRAIRVFVDDVADCYAALGIVHHLWPYLPGEFDDYIANPKDNDYRSLHTAVIGPGGKTLEVQIRTQEMHRHAELGVAAHWRYKEGATETGAFDHKIGMLRRLLEPEEDDGDLLEQFRDDVFEDRVYAVTPRGDVVDLPTGATPLDFAYHVHTQVGHRCRGAKVNGRIVPLTYRIRNGDSVEIITGAVPQPSRDWLSPQLGYLASSRSRTKVRNWFREQDREQNIRQGREVVERELARLNARDQDVSTLAAELRFAEPDQLYLALGAGDLTSAAVARAVQQLRRSAEPDEPELPKRRHARRKAGASGQIAVRGVGDLMCHFARCCRPVPPEPIVGYITQTRGVSIHRERCGNLHALSGRHPERLIDVDWAESGDSYYSADLTVHAYNRQGLLRDISNVLADERVSVEKVESSVDRRSLEAILSLGISVANLPTLSRAMSRLEQLPNVIGVRRSS